MKNILIIAISAGLAFWYWSGPYQQRSNPDYEQRLLNNAEAMRECMRSASRKAGITGHNEGAPQDICAEKLDLYQGSDGRWYSYTRNRR